MGFLDTIRGWFSRKGGHENDGADEFDPELFVYLKIPGDIRPTDRAEWFEDRIDAALIEAGLGTVSGGGSSLGAPRADGTCAIEYCGIDIDVVEQASALTLLRELLPQLPITPGTELQYRRDGRLLRDVYAEGVWTLAQPREELHPGFGV